MSETIEDEGTCLCKSVKFKVSGKVMMSGLCHCKACSRAIGMSPVHLLLISGAESVQVTEGNELLTTTNGYGKMRHTFCSKCGCMVYQYPEGADFRAVLPTNFHIEDGVSCKLPDKYLPKSHVNYENRQYDWHDTLPKFKCFPPEGRVDNQGNEIPS
jgi:hypothetical protein